MVFTIGVSKVLIWNIDQNECVAILHMRSRMTPGKLHVSSMLRHVQQTTSSQHPGLSELSRLRPSFSARHEIYRALVPEPKASTLMR